MLKRQSQIQEKHTCSKEHKNKSKIINYYQTTLKPNLKSKKLGKIHGNDHVTCTISRGKHADHVRSSNSSSSSWARDKNERIVMEPRRLADGVVVCRVSSSLTGRERNKGGGEDGLVKFLSHADSNTITRNLMHHLFHETYAGVFARPQGG